MENSVFKDITNKIRTNWQAGLSLALISFPLSLSLAIVSGFGPTTGLISAFWSSVLGYFLFGSKYLITGIAASLATLQAGFLIKNADYIGDNTASYLLAITLLTGFFITIIRLLKLHSYIKFVPQSIISGFASGVGLIIILKELPRGIGYDLLKLEPTAQGFSVLAFTTFAATLLIIWLNKKFLPKIPAVGVVSILGLLWGYISYKNDYGLPILKDNFGKLSLKFWEIPDFTNFQINLQVLNDLIIISLLIAVVIVIETLISGRYASNLTNTDRSPKKDLQAVGITNMLVSLIGGMPVGGLISRTDFNIKCGANDKMAGLLQGLFLGLIMVSLVPFISYYPYAVTGAILVDVAWKLLNIKVLTKIYKNSKTNFSITLLVAFLVVVANVALAILVGSLFYLLILIRKLSQSEFSLQIYQQENLVFSHSGTNLPKKLPKGTKAIYSNEGVSTYFNAEIDAKRIKKIDCSELIINLQHLFLIDYEALETLQKLVKDLRAQGKIVSLQNLHRNVLASIKNTSLKKYI